LNKVLKNVLKYTVFIAIAVVSFYFAFKGIKFEEFLNDLKAARYEFVFLSMVMGYLAFISRGMRWVLLLEPIGEKANTWHAIHAVTIGYFTNLFVPRAGELARCTALYQTDKVPVNKLFGTVILERVVDFIMLIGLMLLTLIVEFDRLQRFFVDAFAQDPGEDSGGNAYKIIALLMLVSGGIALYFLRHRFSHLPLYGRVKDFWGGIKDGLRSIGKLKSKWPFILHTIFIWAMYYLMVYICVFALPQTKDIDPSSGLFIMIVAGLGMVVPTPGGAGSYHYLVKMAMVTLGISATVGLSFATLVHEGQLLMTIIGGAIAFLAMGRNRIRTKRQAAALKNS
jgi:uncharacterized membrane protein YbhN (UPF0104 family)